MKHNPLVVPVAVIAFALVAIAFFLFSASDTRANEPNVSARVASTSAMQIGPQEVKTLFADTASGSQTSFCASRVISTLGTSAIMLSFDSNITPTATIGHVQAASTTAYYPADIYGCGAVRAYGFASSTVTRTETRW